VPWSGSSRSCWPCSRGGRRPAAPARRKVAAAAVVSLVAAVSFGLILVVIHGAKVPHVEHVASRTAHAFVLAIGAFLVLSVAWLARRREPRRFVRWLSIGVLVAVCVQGTLGGLRVILVDLDLAIVHACFAQAFFCLVAFLILVTSRVWDRLAYQPQLPAASVGLTRVAVLGVVLVYLQLVVGATMRHYDAGLAIPDLPLHYGKMLPPTDAAALADANLMRANSGSPDLRPVTLTQVWLHMGHRTGAVLVTITLLTLIWQAVRRPETRVAMRKPALALLPLLAVQITLGVLTVLWRKPADLASLHVAVGALVLLTTFVLAARRCGRSGFGPVRPPTLDAAPPIVRMGRPCPC
jgi:cytochrome c oxidase assembly protein subunit 15